MSAKKCKPFSRKHASNAATDPVIEKELRHHASNQRIPCALAIEMAERLGVTTRQIGRTADLMNISVVECQLGLFGYQPEKKIVKAADTSDSDLRSAIIDAAVNQRLPCQNAWEIAGRFKIGLLRVGNICQANQIQIKSCRLGAF